MSTQVELIGESLDFVRARFEAGRLRQEYRDIRCSNAGEDVAPCYLDLPDCEYDWCYECKCRQAVFRQYVAARDKAARLWTRLQRHLVRRNEEAEAQP